MISYRLCLDNRLRGNYSFFDPESRVNLSISNPIAFVDRITPMIVRGLKYKTILDLDNAVNILTGEYNQEFLSKNSIIETPVTLKTAGTEDDKVPEAPEGDKTPEAPEIPEVPESTDGDKTPESTDGDRTPEVEDGDKTPEVPEIPETSDDDQVPQSDEASSSSDEEQTEMKKTGKTTTSKKK